MTRLTTAEAFDRAQRIRSDWVSGKFDTMTALAKKYEIALPYCRKILKGEKCKDIAPPKGDYVDVDCYGVRYAVYRDGRVWSYTKNFLMQFSTKGYQKFHVTDTSGVRHKVRVHRLVLETFGPPCPAGCRLVRHLNDIPWDNRFENLAWGTDADNNKDMWKNGSGVNGVRTHTAKLTDDLVVKMRVSYDGSIRLKTHIMTFAEKHGLNMSDNALYGAAKSGWKHVNAPFCKLNVNNTGVDAKTLRKNFKMHKHRFDSKKEFAQAYAKSLSKHLGRPVLASVVRSYL
ncbi:putative HNH endonuclease protein [Erwinia phage vB_EamM_Yoloswag]|uniref:Putative HNH endonuclease protein n=1 Tax=Erwinia phage vB_EamM_Yoloswag TaxID=1958956 RepID=A0A1S6L320_9CAUD|nr:HNH endonuclease [Erwinia phage vB_EamM_Yoloswag]AQT28581.1 putative HNH endonuclease protein [Erwinia phage vB_EamM_Yoloswag]